MSTYRVVFEMVVEADDEDEAATTAIELINGELPVPSLIEEMEG